MPACSFNARSMALRKGHETQSPACFKLLRGLQQRHVSLTDEVVHAQPLSLKVLGNGHDKAEIGLRQLVQSLAVALMYPFR